jgi:hypothetical protein
MCIYYTDRTDLNYGSQEHVIPAAIGGKQKLPADYVSREFNNDISKLEGEVLHTSLIATPREIEGPGKRGKLGEKHATKSEVFVLADSENNSLVALGYIKLGAGYEIPQVIFNTVTGVGQGRGTDVDGLIKFKDDCTNVDITRLRTIIDNELPKDQILLGIQKGIEKNHDCFFAKNEANPLTLTADLIKRLGASINTEKTGHDSYLPVFRRKAILDLNHLRFHAKIAFNYLAYKRGKDYVKDKQFDPIRQWIVKGGENSFAYFSDKNSNPFENVNIKLPDGFHLVYLAKVDNTLIANVYLYGMMGIYIVLSRNFKDSFNTEAFICDWKNQKEYELMEYLRTFYSQGI